MSKRKPYSVGHELHAAVLNAWASGQNQRQISQAYSLSMNRVSLIICAARKRGDFRAVHHYWPDGQIIGRRRHRPKSDPVPSRPVTSRRKKNGRDDERSAVRAS